MATRTIFFQISPLQQGFFYLLSALSVFLCLYGIGRRIVLWRQGHALPPIKDWPTRLKTLSDQMIAHRRIRRRRSAGKMHMLIFFGMLALFIGTNIVGVEHYGAYFFGAHWFYRGWFYLVCKVTLDLFGLGLLIGTAFALARRHGPHSPNMGHSRKDDAFLTLLFAATLTGFMLEGAGLAADPNRAAFLAFSPVGALFARTYSAFHLLTPSNYALVWWIHTPLVLAVIAALPYGRWLHLFVAPLSILLQPERPMGVLEPITMAQVEETGRIGLGAISDMDRWQLLSLDACMECGRCTDVCPANVVGKALDPKSIVLDLRRMMAEKTLPIAGEGENKTEGEGESGDEESVQAPVTASTDLISDEALWACTNCHACVRECPALIRHVDLIDGIRRYRVAEGRLSGSAATMLRQLRSRENPWGLPAAQRLDWTKGLDVPAASAEDAREVLLWVGCAGAFDPRAQKTVRALAQLLQEADVKFTILGPKERCTGDPARRTGDEFLFQQLAEANIGTLDGIGTKQVVTSCPHCFHTLKNEYPQLGGNYAVQHHTQYLAELVESGRLKLPADYADTVTYHDPCFLARVNGETQAPRKLLNGALTIPLVELERRESKTFCCGAGGGRMWMEESPNTRPGVNRAQEIMATGAKTVAVGCPFCKIMVGDSIAQVAGDAAPPVMDVAEVMLAAIQHSSTAQNNSAEPQESAQQQRAQPQNPEHRGGINL